MNMDMKKLCMGLLLGLCYAGVVRAQEIEVVRPPESRVTTDVPGDYGMDVMTLRWEELLRANIVDAIRFYDYSNSAGYVIDDERAYTLFSSQTFLPGLMMARRSGGSMSFRLNDRLNVSAGAYALKYRYAFGGTYNDGVMHAAADYRLLSWLTVGAYGQYSTLSKRNAGKGSILMSPLVPASAFGVQGTAMFNEAIGVQGAVGKELNPFNGKWQTVFGIAPVINFNALFK
jgi:hypothetical protein